MTIGRNSRKSSTRSSIRAPKFLDKSSGFYGRLDEPETTAGMEEMLVNEEERTNGTGDISVVQNCGADVKEEPEMFDFNEGLMEDDDEILLRRKPSRRSSRWRRSSRRKQKDEKVEENKRPSLGTDTQDLEATRVRVEVEVERMKRMELVKEMSGKGKESALVHFPVREDQDDQVLIRDKTRGDDEEEEVKKMKKEQEQGLKAVKKVTVNNYRKVREKKRPDVFLRIWAILINFFWLFHLNCRAIIANFIEIC